VALGCRRGPARGLWTLLVRTGLRRGEALGLRWSDVDLDAETLAVERVRIAVQTEGDGRRVYDKAKPKSAASRRKVTLDADTVAVLKAHRARQLEERLAAGSAWVDDDRVFAREDGTGLDPDGVSRRFRELCVEAGVRPVRLHDSRHGYATLMLAGGVAVEVVSKRLGHSRISVTYDLYVHPDDEQQRKAFRSVRAAAGRGWRGLMVAEWWQTGLLAPRREPVPIVFALVRNGFRSEAGTGIEPVMGDLQSPALPLGYPAGGHSPARTGQILASPDVTRVPPTAVGATTVQACPTHADAIRPPRGLRIRARFARP
jgi:hypothetical protein